ncbi:MAG: hypothetical protein QXS27_05040 [Candidatus Jordarchaeaceae archaeon]
MPKIQSLIAVLLTAVLLTAIVGTTISAGVVSWTLMPYGSWFGWPTIFGWIFPMLPFPF